MSEISVNLGLVSIPEGRIRKCLCFIPRSLSGTPRIEAKIDKLIQHIGALMEITNVLVADIGITWTAEKRERVQKMMWNFRIDKGLESLIAKGNPFTQQELDTLRSYAKQAQEGKIFTSEQAMHFRQLSEKVSSEYPNQDWVADLLKVALFIFAIYAISKLVESD
jgi:hypothetical protein